MPENTSSEGQQYLSEREVRDMQARLGTEDAYSFIKETYPNLPDPFASITLALYGKMTSATDLLRVNGVTIIEEHDDNLIYINGDQTQEIDDALREYNAACNEYKAFQSGLELAGMSYKVFKPTNGELFVLRDNARRHQMNPLEHLIAMETLKAICYYWEDILVDYDQRAKVDPKSTPLVGDKMH